MARFAMRYRDALSSERPRHHQRELFLPKRVAVRSNPLAHDDVRTCLAQRDRPAGRVPEEKRLQRAGDEVRARKRTRHLAWRTVTRTRRGAEDRAVEVRMPKPKGERQLSTRRDTEHRRAFGGERGPKPRPRPS